MYNEFHGHSSNYSVAPQWLNEDMVSSVRYVSSMKEKRLKYMFNVNLSYCLIHGMTALHSFRRVLSCLNVKKKTFAQSDEQKHCSQDHDQDSLLVKRRTDNHSPGPVIRELVPSSHQRSELSNTILFIFRR